MALSKDAPTVLLGAAVILILVRVLLGSGEKIQRHGKRLRKAPDTLPLAGNGLVFLQARQKLFSWFVKCERQTGYETLEISVPTLPPGVIINDPRNLDFVFKNEGLFGKGRFVKQRSWDLFGHGIINVDGELWKAQRKAGLAFLNTATLRVLTDVALPQYLSQSIEHLEEKEADGSIVDLQHVFHEITTQLMGKMAYNMEMHADDDFTSSFDYASGATAERFQNPLWFITEIFLGSKFRKSVRLVKSFGKRIVSRAVADRQTAEEEEKKADNTAQPHTAAADLDRVSGSLVQSLLEAIGDEQIVADAALNYLSAGRDTTAQALTWTFHLLTQHPSVADKIRSEVQDVLAGAAHRAEHSPTSPSPRRRDLDTTLFTPSAMPYTHAVFNESLRLYPPVPFEIKQCARPATLPDGTRLPAGSVVVWCPWAMNRSRTTWGPDADSFRPERWLAPAPAAASQDSSGDGGPRRRRQAVVNRPVAEFPVFNGGPRLCLGKKMAELVAVQVVAAVAWLFEFTPAGDGGPGEERVSKSSLTLPMEGGLPIYVKQR